MSAGVMILQLGVGDRRTRRIASRRHARGINGGRLRIVWRQLAAICGPAIEQSVFWWEIGASGGDLHLVWRKNLSRCGRRGTCKWRVVVAAQIHNHPRRQTDTVPLRRVAAQETLVVVRIDVVKLRHTDGEPVGKIQVEAATAADGDMVFRPTAAIRGEVCHTDERTGEGRKGVSVILVLQTKERIPNTVALARIAPEVTAAVSQKANIVQAGQVVGVGDVKAMGDVRDLVAQVAIAAGV